MVATINQGFQERADAGDSGKDRIQAPAISLPKGGGAIRGMGEKFAANPVTGTGTLTVPLALSPGRSGFAPQLALSYDSGAGNGPFGFGWNLSLPAITRKTDKGLPTYRDGDESDVFLLSGVEDLVPVLRADSSRFEDDATAPGYVIHRYRPRLEGLFARIERWTRLADGDVHWRSLSKDNILTLYGQDDNSRITDPDNPRRHFSWLISETRDDQGNAIIYEYQPENGAGVDLTQAHERNRGERHGPRRRVNRYPKRIKYGNRISLLDGAGRRPRFIAPAVLEDAGWMFEVVFDYGEHHPDHPQPHDSGDWLCRHDPFSTYHAGFEVRTYRLCQRVLRYHHFPEEEGVGQDCLVGSTDFVYLDLRQNPDDRRKGHPVASFIAEITQNGYRRIAGGGYVKKSLPPLEFAYSRAVVHEDVREIDAESLENLPLGIDGASFRWVDLDGEGISGILSEQGGAWFYKPNLGESRFGPLRPLAHQPSLALLSRGRQQLLDLAGDGQLDLAEFGGPTPGFYERTQDENWEPFRAFDSLPNLPWDDPNLRFVDLSGDGHADVLITEHEVFTWHPALAEAGFGPARSVSQPRDEELGPKLVFADGTQSIYLADMCGDGLSDLVRVRNGEVCYWPNLGYGRFGAKVAMDDAPWFDLPDRFDQRRLRLADIDGSGNNDLIYLGSDGVRLYFNQSGNRWSAPHQLDGFPKIDNLASVMTADLFGNGTACLVWSSPLPGDTRRHLRYLDLMGGQKPHLLVSARNNLGTETRVRYAASTRFYLADKAAGKPWITRLPFPVHVVERLETYDYLSRNRFVTRYAYHHGYFDGPEREFRGFGMVEQWDTEEIAGLSADGEFPPGDNIDPVSHVPPVHTRTWFHTGAYLGRAHISDYFAGLLPAQDQGEYYREPGLDNLQARALLLEDTRLPAGLAPEAEREACRALKGSMLRQEVYALYGTDLEQHPYTVTEQNFTIRCLQPQAGKRPGVFFTHAREVLSYHYERDPEDPRLSHTLTLEVDDFGNVLKTAAVGYGRRQPDMGLAPADRDRQTTPLITYTENLVTGVLSDADHYCTPLPGESRTYELTGYPPTGPGGRYRSRDFVGPDPLAPGPGLIHLFDSEIAYEAAPGNGRQRRLIEQVRVLYRPDDLGAAANNPLALLPLGTVEPLALPGETYKLAFTPGLLAQVFQRPREGQAPEDLLPDPAVVLPADLAAGQVGDRGGYVDLDGDGRWWLPSGRVFYSPHPGDNPAAELAHARLHFFLPRRFRDPFGAATTVTFDAYDLLMVETCDPVGNLVTAGERDAAGHLTTPGNDYRVLQPGLLSDANRNRTATAFDALGMVVGTAVMGKPGENSGDSLAGFETDLAEPLVLAHLSDPLADPHALLQGATTRLVYDLFAYTRTRNDPLPQPAVVYTQARETHDSDLEPGQLTRIQHSFSYSDGFGREIQKKVQAEPGPLAEGGPEISPRWVGSGWTIFNNKSNPVRQYEPFFSATHGFEFARLAGVSPILFYDPAGRVVATLHPNNTYEKVTFTPWRQTIHDVNDTVLLDPRTDQDIGGYVAAYFDSQPPTWQTWHASRAGGALGAQEQAAAMKTAAHADTPTVAHFDTLGRLFLTVADNGLDTNGNKQKYRTRVYIDIEGNQREVRDAIEQNGDPQGRVVMRYHYDLLGNRIHQESMDAGARWMLNDVAGKPLRAWDSRGHTFRTAYDPARRPLRLLVNGADPAHPGQELLTERLVYGEQHPENELRNLRGRLYLHLDQAGVVANEAHDFKGNQLRVTRRLGKEYQHAVDWSAVEPALPADPAVPLDPPALEGALAPLLEAENFTGRTAYDALNRPVTLTTPDNSVIRPAYNEANLLERVDACLRGAQQDGQPVWTPFVTDIDYSAKGQRTLIDYGNGVRTTYAYDPLTFRLTHLLTRRHPIVFPDDCPDPPPAGWPGCQVQNLRYTYDPAGNITHVRDSAQQTVYFNNQRVESSGEYTYDALYRLTQATGREHLGQLGGAPVPPSHSDAPRVGIWNQGPGPEFHPGDGNALGTYVQQYLYDAVGNIKEMKHIGSSPAHPGWTRSYAYLENSLLEPAKQGNRLSRSTIGNQQPLVEPYCHDAHGNISRMPHLANHADPAAPNLHWDYKDQLRQTDLGGGGTAYYGYDAAGRRVRKVWEKSPGLTEERIYLGGFEVFRRRNGNGAVTLERQTLHLMDDRQRLALVETRTQGDDPGAAELIRYQINNHLGSAVLELDREARIISYEEYYPYGSSSYQAVRSQTETPKRYRYTGKERDEESGLYYYGARYYAPWLARWTSCDSYKTAEAVSLYAYVKANPIRLHDPNGAEEMCGVWDEEMQECRPEPCVPQVPAPSEQPPVSSEWGWESPESEPVSPQETPSLPAELTPPPNVRVIRRRPQTIGHGPRSEPPPESGPESSVDPLSALDPLVSQEGMEFARVGATRAEYAISAAQMSRGVMQTVETGAISTTEGAATAVAGRRAIEAAARENLPSWASEASAARNVRVHGDPLGPPNLEAARTAGRPPGAPRTDIEVIRSAGRTSPRFNFAGIAMGILGTAAMILQAWSWSRSSEEHGYIDVFPFRIATDPSKFPDGTEVQDFTGARGHIYGGQVWPDPI